MKPRLLAAAIACVVCVPAAAALVTVAGYTRLEAAGQVTADGHGLVVQLTGPDEASRRPFHIQGATIRIEVDSAERNPAMPASSPEEAHTTRVFSGETTLRSTAPKSAYRLFVGSASAWQLEGTEAAWVHAAPHEVQKTQSPAQNRSSPRYDTDGYQTLDSPGRLVLHGPLVAVFFAWDIEYLAGDEWRLLQSGSGYDSPLPPGLPPYGGRAWSSEIYVFVDEGIMELDLSPDDVTHLYALTSKASLNGSLQAHGALLRGEEQPSNLTWLGDYELTFQGAGLQIEAPRQSSSPAPETSDVGAQSATDTAMLEARSEWVLHWTWFVPALAALAVGGMVWRRRCLVRTLRDAMDLRVYETVVQVAPRLYRTRFGGEARILHAVALLQMGLANEAQMLLRGAPGRHAPAASIVAFVSAHGAAVMSDAVTARRMLRKAILLDATFEAEARRNPVLASVLDGSAWSMGYA